MNKNIIEDLKSQMEEIQAALAALEPDAECTASEVASVDQTESEAHEEDAVLTAPPPPRELRQSRSLPGGRLVRVLLAMAVVLAAAGAWAAYALGRNDLLPKGVAFRVLGHNVTVNELNARVDTLAALYGVEVPSDKARLAGFRRDVAKAFAVSMILDSAAEDRDIAIADKAASDVLSRYVNQQFGGGSEAYPNFVQALGSVGTSEPAVLGEIKRQLAISQLYDKVTAGVTVSDEDVQASFAMDHSALDTPERREIRNIVVATRDQAKGVRAKLLAGGSFAALARSESLDGSTRNSGGSLGTAAAADLEGAYAEAAFGVAAGGVFGPVQTEHGWNVGQVVRIVPRAPAVFSKVKAVLKEQLLVKRELEVWREWLAAEIRHADVAYASKYRPTDPDAPPSSQPDMDLPGTRGDSTTPSR
jgi:peptidyl-prolyl cis-trans isomerase C